MPTLTFTSGNDSYEVTTADDYSLSFLAGNDTLTTRNLGATTTASMGDGADVVSHRGGTATVSGDAGADRFEVYASGLIADGGADSDLFNIRSGSGQALSGGLGADRFNFYGDIASILLHGDDGDDDFFGYFKAIGGSLHGDAGNDYFVGFVGGLALYGGTGNDIYRVDPADFASFIENVGEGTDSVQVARGATFLLPDNIENISVQGFHGTTTADASLYGNALANAINGHVNNEAIYGYDGNDRLFGKGGSDVLQGGNGDDYLDGGDGIDQLAGGAGNDTLQGRAGNDSMQGGVGDDTYYVDDIGDNCLEAQGEGIDTIRVSVDGFTLSSSIDNGIVFGATGRTLSGNGLDNRLTGNAGADTLNGGDGADIVNGGGGNDTLAGNDGNDALSGGEGNDTMEGGLGVDTISGGAGADTLSDLSGVGNIIIGGAGADVIDLLGGISTVVYVSVADSPLGAPDQITTFAGGPIPGQDKIDLSAIDANVNVAGDQAFTVVGSASTGNAGDLWWASNHLYGDVNGDGVADLEIIVSGGFVPARDMIY